MKKSLLILSSLTLNVLAVVAQTTGLVTDVCGNTYNYVKIGGQYWMAENLKCTTYDTQSERAGNTLNTSDIGTYAPIYIDGKDVVTDKSGNLSTEQRQKLGLLYNWAAAVGLANESESQAMTSTFSVPRQGICPNGWHLPTDAEYEALITHIETIEGKGEGTAGKQLKSTSGWYDDGNGADLYGFEALPAGHVTASAGSTIGMRTYYWTSTPINEDYAYEYYLRHDNDKLERYSLSKFEVRSIRCVRSPIIKFINYDGNELQSTEVAYGAMPVYTGATPTKPLDAEYTYTFTGWDNEIEPVTEDKTYAVVFKAVSNGTIRDICGNAYHYVKIGNQVWLAENMKCNKYDTESERAGATLSAYGESSYYKPYYADGRNTTTSYSGNLTNEQKAQLGLLYNWAAAVGYATEAEAKIDTYEYNGFRQGICPNGWHIPTTTEWEELVKTIGGESIAGSKLKTTSGWYEDGNGRDLYGFASLPAGFAGGTNIKEIGGVTSYWTDKPHSVNETYLRFTNYTDANLFDSHSSKENARSVRCLKDRYVSISFLNYDGNELQNSEVEYGATPVYTGATPTKPSDAEYTYTFTGWDNEIEPVTEDKTYTAVFKVVSNGAVSDICGNTYRYVKIGNQVWLAENMKCNKYDTESEQAGVTLPTSNSTTYAPYYTDGRNTTTSYSGNLTDAQREKLGFLYNWAAVVGLSSASEAKEQTTAFGGTRQGICPNGWHVPSETEWNELAETLGGSADSGKKLKTTSGWYDNGNGTDLYGFEALPAGYGNAYSVLNVGYGAYFWTATPYDEEFARNKYFNYTMDNLGSANISKWYVRSVRCVKTKYAEIIFLNDDGTELQISEVEYGATPVYTGATPYKPSDSEEYKYVFSGWDSEIVPATEDKVYTATFVTRPVYKNGVLNGEFSVGENKKVHFSQGNLQYNAALGTHQCADGSIQQGTWRFAENQWDYVGDATRGTVYENGIKCDNSLISSTYNGWIDLFGWGTSGWDSGANAFQPFSTSNNQADYYPGGDYNTDLQGLYAYSDWGVYNAIANGGDMPNLWYTLSDVEWKYLFNTRENAENLRGNATVNGIHCYLILPDLWSLPQGLTFTPGTNSWDKNVYSLVEWFQMEDAGAVLVSNALRRVGSTQFDPTIAYWSSSHSVDQPAKSALGIAKETTYEAGLNFSRSVGHSVRLVQRVKYEVKFVNYDSEGLQSEELEYGETPVYKGSTPVKPADAQYTYTFNGWEPEITEVIGPQTYTAQFSSTTNKYTIRFLNDNGEVLQSESLDYGATPEYKGSEPTKPATAQYTYTFNGWDKTITTVTEATDYTATYSSVVNKYEIKFVNYDGTELQSEELDYGATPEYKGQTPVKPTDVQYTYMFNGWSPEIVEVTEAKTYTAQFSNTTNKYTIRFLNDNGEVLQSESLYYGATPEYKGSTPTKPTTTQYTYTFAGWDKTITTVTEATDYTATYNSVVNKYEIKFVNYDGEELQSEELDYGATPEYKGQTPVKPADAQYTYIFIGWSPEIAEVTEAKTYTAQFSSTTNKYTIRFLNDDGDVLQSESLDYGATPEYKGSVPTKPATAQYTYAFAGWDKTITTVTEATDYTATYSSVVNKYEIKFANYDGTELQSEELDYGATPEYKGQTPVKPSDAQYTYMFNGWSPEITEVTGLQIYTAQFSSTTNKYTVRFLNDNGDVLQSENLDYGSTPEYKGSEPTKPATAQYTYTFNGWDKTITTVTEATDYTATYSSTVNMYEIKFVNYNGDELQSEELEYGVTPVYKGQTPVKPADAQYTYTFSGWSPEIVEVTEAKTYTAQFSNTTNKYTIRFLNDNGEVLQSESLYYGATPEYKGSTPTKPTTAQYTYTFAGWDKTITTVTEATDYTATYNSVVNKYEIKFVNYDGEELQSEELDYGATPKYKGQTPVKPADAQYTYTFSGWEPEIAEVTEPKTYTAQFSSITNKYTVKTIAQTEGVTTGDGVYDYGETATLTATPNEGYEFTYWSNGEKSSAIHIIITKDTTLTAYFQFIHCTVEKDIDVSVPEGGEITLKSGKTIFVTKSQRIDDLKVTPLKCDSLFHYNITMIRQSADNTPACDNAPSVAKYDWLFMINVKALNAQGYAFGEGNVSWYRIVGEMDNIDDPASMHTDQLVGKGYGYTIDKSFVGTGDYYALIDLPKQTSEVGCKGIMRTQVFRYGASKRSAPAVIPTIAYPNQRMQVMHLPQEENCEIYVYDNVGKLCRHFASHGADTAEFEAEMRQGSYIVVIKSADGTESVKYIVK